MNRTFHNLMRAPGDGENPLCVNSLKLSVELGSSIVVKELLILRANPNQRYEESSTPLIEAASLGHRAVCLALLEARADVHSTDARGWTALCAACAGAELDDSSSGPHSPDLATLSLLLERRADVNQQAYKGETPLILAIASENRPLVDLLLQADVRFGIFFELVGLPFPNLRSASECPPRVLLLPSSSPRPS